MPPEDEIAFEILRAIRRILRKASEHSRQLSRETGLTVPQSLCLRAVAELAQHGEVTVARLSRAVHLSSPTVSRILDRLEQAGYVARQRRSHDRRKVCLSLTETGEQRVGTLPVPLQEQFLSRLKQLDHERQQLLLRSLEQIVDMMEASQIEASPLLVSDFDVKAPGPELKGPRLEVDSAGAVEPAGEQE